MPPPTPARRESGWTATARQWMPAAIFYFITADGLFDASSGGTDYGDSFIKLSSAGAVLDYFRPWCRPTCTRATLIWAPAACSCCRIKAGPHTHEMVSASKNATIYLVDRDNMGHYQSNTDQIIQELVNIFPNDVGIEGGNFGSPVYFNGNVYFGPVSSTVQAFALTNGLLSTAPTSQSAEVYEQTESEERGATMAISANGNTNGILWTLQSNDGESSPGTLHAYDATNLGHELYTSDQAGTRDTLDAWWKFSVPLVVNGRVYVSSTSQLTVYGLLP